MAEDNRNVKFLVSESIVSTGPTYVHNTQHADLVSSFAKYKYKNTTAGGKKTNCAK